MAPEDIILKPVLTEKGYDGIADKKYTFFVAKLLCHDWYQTYRHGTIIGEKTKCHRFYVRMWFWAMREMW